MSYLWIASPSLCTWCGLLSFWPSKGDVLCRARATKEINQFLALGLMQLTERCNFAACILQLPCLALAQNKWNGWVPWRASPTTSLQKLTDRNLARIERRMQLVSQVKMIKDKIFCDGRTKSLSFLFFWSLWDASKSDCDDHFGIINCWVVLQLITILHWPTAPTRVFLQNNLLHLLPKDYANKDVVNAKDFSSNDFMTEKDAIFHVKICPFFFFSLARFTSMK